MERKIIWQIYSFAALSANMIYEILRLRSAIFVVEQADIYLDADNKDQEATHLVGMVDNEIAAYSRVFPKGTYFADAASFGRFLVAKDYRTDGVGKQLIAQVLAILREEDLIRISAQSYLQPFYTEFGFVAYGKPYLDGTIEHVDMQRIR